jgi:hypothetical protein
MVVDIINKTLDTTAIVKNTDTDIYREPYCILILMVTFTKNWELVLFLEKVDQLGTKSFTLEQKFKDSTIQQYEKNTSCFNETPSSSWWNNFYTYGLLLGFILFMNRKIIPNLLFY